MIIQDSFILLIKDKFCLIGIIKISDLLKKQNDLISHLDREPVLRRFVKISKILKILENQFFMLEEILNSFGSEKELLTLKEKYAVLDTYIINVTNPDKICYVVLNFALEFLLHNLIRELEKVTNRFYNGEKAEKTESNMGDLQIVVINHYIYFTI